MTTAPIFEGVADVEAQAQRMRAFHLTGATLQVEYRREALLKLKAYLKANEEREGLSATQLPAAMASTSGTSASCTG